MSEETKGALKVRAYYVMAFVALVTLALGLYGVLDKEVSGQVLLAIIAAIQAWKQGDRESEK